GAVKGSCPDRAKQIPGDPYSPPCIAFSGSNGGTTSRGVTASEVKVAFRVLNEKGFAQTLAALAGAQITDTPSDVRRTVTAFQQYFNKHFQFYGRKIKIQFYNGKGSSTNELLGGGQAEAQADAIHVAQELKAFAEINGASAPFSDALSRQKVIAFGTPYLSRAWHVQHRPWNWSIATDCSIVAETAAEYYVNLLAGKRADYAGDGIKGKPRVLAGLSPENPWYAVCHRNFEQVIEKQTRKKVPVHINYRLDINSMSNQAANVIAQLKNAGSTTIFCGCDPIFPVFLTTKASEQNYFPEWVVVGVALTDHDLVGQLYDQDQWKHAAGVSYAGEVLPQRAGLGYAAYKTIRNDEPAFAVEIIYAQMYMLALGIQLAGPRLTPQSYERGMFSYPGGTGMYGTWGFGPGQYTPTRDARIIWWNPNRVSIYNNKRGAYVTGYGGRRFSIGNLPKGNPDIFR
ncbi:MAG TPA: hypothetical protein VHK90_11705, partial [Thermoanaerobaculia bacterium]|nr:hypothetical protein [Thermoanaerobaculia bacterium]